MKKSSNILSAFLNSNKDQDIKQSKEGTDNDTSMKKREYCCLLLSRKKTYTENIQALSPAKVVKRDIIELANKKNNFSTLGATKPGIHISEGRIYTTYPAADEMSEKKLKVGLVDGTICSVGRSWKSVIVDRYCLFEKDLLVLCFIYYNQVEILQNSSSDQ